MCEPAADCVGIALRFTPTGPVKRGRPLKASALMGSWPPLTLGREMSTRPVSRLGQRSPNRRFRAYASLENLAADVRDSHHHMPPPYAAVEIAMDYEARVPACPPVILVHEHLSTATDTMPLEKPSSFHVPEKVPLLPREP